MERFVKIWSWFFITALFTMRLWAQAVPADSLYLGQTPPGNVPKIFNLPVSSGHRACERIAITSNGAEIYYGELNTYPVTSSRIRCVKYVDNHWLAPVDLFEGFTGPKLSVNDSIIYMQDNTFYTYYAVRTVTGWSTPVKLLSTNLRMHYFQKTNTGNAYASSYYEGSTKDGNLCKVVVVNQDTILQSLGAPINSSNHENDFYIAGDESYILFSRNVSGGAGDIYLSLKVASGRWSNPKKLGEAINKPGNSWEYGQFVSKDNKYLFFTKGGTSMSTYYTYWVKIDNIIDSTRHTNFIPYVYNQIPGQSAQTGQMFTYTVPDTTFIDDDGNTTLTYSAALSNGNALPSWLTFTPGTRSFSGTPTEAQNITVQVKALDSAGVSVSNNFTISITTTANDRGETRVPESMQLFQNYPNPFNPTTTIGFAIPTTGRYTLCLYNPLGELVKSIADKEYSAGYHKETLDASGISSGMYVCRLSGDKTFLTRKLVVLR